MHATLHDMRLWAVGLGLLAATLMSALAPVPARAQQSQLPTVVVTGEGEGQRTGVVGGTDRSAETEGVESYTTSTTTIGTKAPASIREIPQTVNVITRQQLDDQNLTSIEKALEWDPGVIVATGNLFAASLYARGHEIFNYSIDGINRPLQSIYGTTPDLSFFDRVEVLSGPSALFNGTGEPGASINLARKRAGTEPAAFASFYGGMWDTFRGEVDVTAPLNESGRLRGRVVAYALQEDSFVDVANQERYGTYGTIEADLTLNTTLSIGGIFEHQRMESTSGLPTFLDGTLIDAPRSSYVGADWNRNYPDRGEAFVELDHIFRNDATFHAALRYNEVDANILTGLGLTAVDPATGNFGFFAFGRNYDEESLAFDSYVTVPFQLFGNENAVTVGADYRKSDQFFEQQFAFLGANNIFALRTNFPEPILTFPGFGFGGLNQTTEFEETGVYGQFKLSPVERVTVLLGGRSTWYDNLVRNEFTRVTSTIDESDTTGYAGITVDVTPNAALYGSYTEIFQPQSEADADGIAIGARTGFQYEFGLKTSLLNDRLNFQAAWFNLEDSNRAVNDPANLGTFAATGDVRSRGVDVRVAGSPLPGLLMTAGYVYTDTEALSDDPLAEFGEIAPRHSATAFAKYTFPKGSRLAGLGIGAGVRGVSEFFSIFVDRTGRLFKLEAPGYVVADAQFSYDFNDHVRAQLDVTNLFDNTYFQRVNDVTRGNFYGEPLRVMFRVTARR